MKKKRLYEKPKISKVNLVPEEAVLTGCKTSSGSGGKSERCPNGCQQTTGS